MEATLTQKTQEQQEVKTKFQLIHKSFLELFNFTADYHYKELRHILIDLEQNKIIASNGFMLITKELNNLEPEKFLPVDLEPLPANSKILIPYEEKENIKKAFMKKPFLNIFNYALLGMKDNKPCLAIVSDINSETKITYIPCLFSSDYPDWQGIAKSYESKEPMGSTSLNIGLLKIIFDTLSSLAKQTNTEKKHDKDWISIKLFVYENNTKYPQDAIKIVSEKLNAEILLMSMIP